jgi:hypothetical protein
VPERPVPLHGLSEQAGEARPVHAGTATV